MEKIFSITLREDGWKYFLKGKRKMKNTGNVEIVTAIEHRQLHGRAGIIDAFDVYYDDRVFVTIYADEIKEIRYNIED